MRYIYLISVSKKNKYTLISKNPITKRETFNQYVKGKGHNPNLPYKVEFLKIKK